MLQRRETRLTDGFPVTRLMLFEQAAAHQTRNAALTNLYRRDYGCTTPVGKLGTTSGRKQPSMSLPPWVSLHPTTDSSLSPNIGIEICMRAERRLGELIRA